MLSISLLTAISIDRYVTFVKHVFTNSQRSWYLKPIWLTLFAWVYGTSLNLPVFHSADVIPIDFKNSTVYYCTTTQGGTLSGKIYLIVSVSLGFVLPLATMIVSYYHVIRVVWTRNRRLSSSFAPESNAAIKNAKLLERSRKSVLRMLLTVVICFVFFWLPFSVYHGILERYLKEPPNPMDVIRIITYGLGLANSTCNPFIYYFNAGGKSFCSIKRRFIEAMGDRSRTFISRSEKRACDREVPGDMVELGFDKINITCSTNNTSQNNCVEFAFTNDLQGSQEVINTQL